jgi:hypothetical protein
MIFLLVWIVVSLTYVYLVCDISRLSRACTTSLGITLAATILMIGWWTGRLTYEYREFNSLINSVFHSEYGLLLFLGCVTILYLIPVMIPDKIRMLRTGIQKILLKRDRIYTLVVAGAILGSIVVFLFILGNLKFSLSYPLPMFFNGICMIILTLIGVYYFLDLKKIHILAWGLILALITVLSMGGIIAFVDPLRFMEFLYVPLAIIAASGLSRMAGKVKNRGLIPVGLAIFFVVSLVTSFPSIVFLNDTFEPGHPLYDSRSRVIQHEPSEIYAISWLDDSQARGVLETDAYVGYAARGIIDPDGLVIQSQSSFVKEGEYPQDANGKQHYLLIISRFYDYQEFGAQWLKEKKPLSGEDLLKIDKDCNVIYSNGNAVIFSYATQ